MPERVVLTDEEKNSILTTGRISVRSTCQPCAGTGWDHSTFSRCCTYCHTHWDDMNGDKSGSVTLEAWEKDSRSQLEMPCGHSWAYYRENDKHICIECDGSGYRTYMLPVEQMFDMFFDAFIARSAKQLRLKSGLTNRQ